MRPPASLSTVTEYPAGADTRSWLALISGSVHRPRIVSHPKKHDSGHRGKAVGLLGVLDIGDRLGVQVLQGLVEGTVGQRQLRGPARAPGGNAGDELQHRTEVKPREAGPGDASVLRNATPDIQPRPERYGGRDLLHAPPVRRPKWQFPVATSPATADQNEPDFNASLGWGISSSYSWTEAA
jgi:hypothetical protein